MKEFVPLSLILLGVGLTLPSGVLGDPGHKPGRSVGVWMDDGNGNTVLADRLDSEEAAELARDMLDLLKLPAPPNLVRHERHRRNTTVKASAPIWLKSVYDNLDEHGHATNVDDSHRETVTAADTIITFVNRDPPSGRPSKGSNKRLYFDVSDVPLDHSLLAAEIQVFRHHGYHTEDLTLHVYMVIDENGNEQEVEQIPLHEYGWKTINITTAVLSWLIFPDTNRGLRLSVTATGERHERHFNEIGITGTHGEEENRPFMVGFFAIPGSSPKSHMRKPRSLPTNPTSKPRTYREWMVNIPKIRGHHGPLRILQDLAEMPPSDNLCKLKHLHVSFRDLQWENWVIAPEGYDANYCEGRCQFPLNGDMNATNHALVQTLVKIIDGVTEDQEVPPHASCAPIDLATIPVLYYSYGNNIVLKKYPKMIVKTCGCH